PFKPIVILAESDLLIVSTKRRPTNVGMASMLQLDIEPIQGLHAIATGELLNAGVGDTPTSFGAWASLAWFFAPHADVLFDLVQQSVGAAGSRTGVTSLLFQLHGFL